MYHIAGATHVGTVKPKNEDHILINGKILNSGEYDNENRTSGYVCE